MDYNQTHKQEEAIGKEYFDDVKAAR